MPTNTTQSDPAERLTAADLPLRYAENGASWWSSQRNYCTGSDKLGFRGAVISTVNARYGQGLVNDNTCTNAIGYFVKRPATTGSGWKVIGILPDSAQDCSMFARLLPREVIGDFGVEGAEHGTFGRCAPKPQAPSLPVDPCIPRHGSIGDELLRSVECAKDRTVLEVKCGVEASVFLFPALKYLKVIETAKDVTVLASLPVNVRPFARFLFHIYHAPILKDAPQGYQTTGEILEKLKGAKDAAGLAEQLPSIFRAIGVRQFGIAAEDLGDAAGLESCINGLKKAASR